MARLQPRRGAEAQLKLRPTGASYRGVVQGRRTGASYRGALPGRPSVVRRFFDAIDNDHVNRRFRGFQPQAKLSYNDPSLVLQAVLDGQGMPRCRAA